ncbi:hypothetical protein LOY64_04515 [Pseudomonas corrugata]|uniref:hypothetical protein n=1 Tax=Pseudomonas corrugata TaxID=47879 RepID=UPI002230443B|nr:hypothetical protein [Pseudomonas corrugata]UZD96277.1 hypothetical protein LOY64_04515 [Pseudomonas corrugata]
MSVQPGPTEKRYAANGVTTIYAVPFLVIEAGDLKVYLNGVLQTSGYTQTGVGQPTSSVTFTIAPTGDLYLVLDVPFQRLVDYQENGDFLSSTVNRDFDRIWQALKQLLTTTSRSPVLGVNDVDGDGWYLAKGNGIRNLRDPVEDQDAATKGAVAQMIADAVGTGEGPINNAANITYVTPGSKITTVAAKLAELVSLSDHNSLRDALAAGAMVRVPATVTSISVSASDSPFVLPNLYRVSAEGDLTINLGAGLHDTLSGVICRAGVRNSTVKLLGVAPLETKATAVNSIYGVAGDWQITYTVADATGIQVGDYAKLFDVGPLPILMGDNAAATILRNYPLKGELYNPARVNAGSATVAQGGASISFAGVGADFLSSMLPGDLFTIKGQTEVLATVTPGAATISGVWANGGVTSSTAFYVTRASAGTIGTGGVASSTVTGVGSLFLTEGNIGDVLLVRGQMVKIIGIGSNLSLTLDKNINIPNGSPYTILQSAAALHGGVHEVVGVSGNQVALRNRCTPKPPINGVSVDEFRILKTVLKQSGTGDGFIFDQNGSLREVNNLVIVGTGLSTAPVGVLLQNRIPSETSEGGVSFGDVTQHGLRGTVLFGENVGITRFGRGAMVGHGCLLNARKVAFTNNREIGVWALEGSFANLRRSIITGDDNGLNINPGATAKITEIIVVGCQGDGIRSEAGATVYGEGPALVSNTGMNYRGLDTHRAHFTDGVSLAAGLSGAYLAGASARLDRMVIGASSRSGVEMAEDAQLIMDKGWISGTSNTGGQGFGINMGNGSSVLATNTAVVSNNSNDIQIGTALNVETVLSACNYASMSGVTRPNSPNASGSVIWDGTGADTGSTVPTVGGSGGPGTGTGVASAQALNWTRDKDRYFFDGRLTATTIGDWTGYLTVSLPFTVTANTAISATNQTTGAVLSGYATGTQLRLYTAAGAFPIANGQTILFTGAARV